MCVCVYTSCHILHRLLYSHPLPVRRTPRTAPQVQRGSKAAAAAELPGLSSSSAPEPYKNTWDGVRRIMRSEGVRGLFRGSLARISFHTPLTMISMSLYDECKKFYGRQLGTALS